MSEHNKIYQEIVTGEKDLIGIIAYSVYKRQKVEIIENIKKRKNSSEVSSTELTEFKEMSNTKTQIESYRNEAQYFLKEYADILMKDKLEEIERYYRKKAVGGFFTGVWQSVVGSVIFALMVGVFIFILWSTQFGVEDVIKNIFEIGNKK
ncbi:hypothetical protein [Tenacibaculum soleae]|uniref:hypothetical protein n=1 Tax=Tenacibaculum soleae TaxID=447689 RepID=UPI0026E48780|nr:hypothetical protein [Tenacibaculum soleae]MDO6814070.1 hypothetical protein [Tenacibaculum soleae]